MAHFYPALADTDNLGFIDESGERRLMSIRSLMPKRISERFLISLSFDESHHYNVSDSQGDPNSDVKVKHHSPVSIFVDCGAFHYKSERVPRFRGGGFTNAITSIEQYHNRHLSRGLDCEYLLCSPDHIISPDCDDEEAMLRREFTLTNASEFIALSASLERVQPVGVVHGRNMEERAEMTRELIGMGFEYIAFGGLVPLASNQPNALLQLTGVNPPDLPNFSIRKDSPLGIARKAGVKTHIFGLNSPDWYRWIKRLGVDSFDGSKLSQEGAKNGIIWIEENSTEDRMLVDANGMYRKFPVKSLDFTMVCDNSKLSTFGFNEEVPNFDGNPGWDYLCTSRCTSTSCIHGPENHNCDPRVFGSIEHNMGRTIINSWVFESIMERIDDLVEEAKTSENENLQRNWSPIEVE